MLPICGTNGYYMSTSRGTVHCLGLTETEVGMMSVIIPAGWRVVETSAGAALEKSGVIGYYTLKGAYKKEVANEKADQ